MSYLWGGNLEQVVSAEVILAAYPPTPPSTVPDGTLAAADLESVDAVIDAALAVRYTVPITSEHGLAVAETIARALMRELVYGRLPNATVPESVTAAANRARELLDALADGSRVLPGTVVASEAGGMLYGGPEAAFDEDGLDQW